MNRKESVEEEVENNRKGIIGNRSIEVSEEAGGDKLQSVGEALVLERRSLRPVKEKIHVDSDVFHG